MNTKTKAKLIVFEGPDGVGKTTLISSAAQYLRQSGVPFLSLSFPGKTPGTLGELVDRIHHSPKDFHLPELTPLSLQALHIAAHLDAIETRIRPALLKNITVLLDRIWWSTWVYGRSAHVEESVLSTLVEAEKLFWGNLLPATTFLIERASAFRPEHNQETFDALSLLYKQLAAREELCFPVVRVANDDLQASEQTIRESITSILSV
jgi:dTMP kinase